MEEVYQARLEKNGAEITRHLLLLVHSLVQVRAHACFQAPLTMGRATALAHTVILRTIPGPSTEWSFSLRPPIFSLQALLAVGLLELRPWKPRTVGMLGIIASALNCYMLFPALPAPAKASTKSFAKVA